MKGVLTETAGKAAAKAKAKAESTVPTKAEGPGQDEAAFQAWRAKVVDPWAKKFGRNPDVDDPRQQYDYRRAFRAGATPDESGHWDSRYKLAGHPNRYVKGVDTITGKKVK